MDQLRLFEPRSFARCVTQPPTLRARAGITVEVKPALDLTDAESGRCSELTLPVGRMHPELKAIRNIGVCHAANPTARNRRLYRHSRHTKFVVLIRRDVLIVGWALVMAAIPTVYMFIAEDRRRQGLGTLLLSEVHARWPDAECCPWDQRSYRFFRSQTRPLRFSFSARRWIDEHLNASAAVSR